MEPIASPDVPAYVCYLIVLVVGLLVGITRVNRLMASSPGRWRFFQTWMLFGAYALVPPFLFWFLDFTNALHDTSIVGALVVSLGYRQILSGEMKGVAAASPASRLWSPLEAWANQVRERIVTKSKLHSDRFNEEVRAQLAEKPDCVEALVALAYQSARSAGERDQLTAGLAALAAEPKPGDLADDAFARIRIRRKVELAIHALRIANSEDYGYLLVQHKLVSQWEYRLWLGNLQAHLTQGIVVCLLFGLIGWSVWSFFRPANLLCYHQWRFVKASATEPDRYRTYEFIEKRLAAATNDAAVAALLDPLTRWLRYREVSRQLAEDVLRLVVHHHDLKRNRVTIPVLVDALRTENPDVRLRILEKLKALQSLDYSPFPLDADLARWVPSKTESVEKVEEKRQKFFTWWNQAKGQ